MTSLPTEVVLAQNGQADAEVTMSIPPETRDQLVEAVAEIRGWLKGSPESTAQLELDHPSLLAPDLIEAI
jgi:hypothetical protein